MIEVVVSAMVMSLVLAGIVELLYLHFFSAFRAFNSVSGVDGAQFFMSRVAEQVRTARNFGNMPPYALALPVLSPQSIMVQVPVYDAQGFPLYAASATGNAGIEKLDTYVYEVVADTRPGAGSGEYMVRRYKVSWKPSDTVQPTQVEGPDIVLSGIVGPIDPVTSQPAVFRYLLSDGATPGSLQATSVQSIAGFPAMANVKGVRVTLEIRSTTASELTPHTFGLKKDLLMRTNSDTTLVGMPVKPAWDTR